MSFPIIFNSIIVNGQETNSTVSVGQNQQDGWAAHCKQNVGVGMLFGLNNTINTLNVINDCDLLDAPISDNDIIPSAQGQAL